MKRIDPLFKETGALAGRKGKVVIGTVNGDIHYIGKNIVVALLRGSGFDAIDLGIDVPNEKFVEAVKTSSVKVQGLSALLNSTYPVMKNVVDAITETGLRDAVKIIIGGAPVNELREFSGADHAAQDVVAGIEICKQVYALPKTDFPDSRLSPCYARLLQRFIRQDRQGEHVRDLVDFFHHIDV